MAKKYHGQNLSLFGPKNITFGNVQTQKSRTYPSYAYVLCIPPRIIVTLSLLADIKNHETGGSLRFQITLKRQKSLSPHNIEKSATTLTKGQSFIEGSWCSSLFPDFAARTVMRWTDFDYT